MKKKPLKFNVGWNINLPRPTNNYNGELAFDYDTQKLFMYDNNSWVELCEKPDDAIVESQNKYPTHCPNCGAPHNPNNNYCEYCGTFFD